jgi:hypothetical protein
VILFIFLRITTDFSIDDLDLAYQFFLHQYAEIERLILLIDKVWLVTESVENQPVGTSVAEVLKQYGDNDSTSNQNANKFKHYENDVGYALHLGAKSGESRNSPYVERDCY